MPWGVPERGAYKCHADIHLTNGKVFRGVVVEAQTPEQFYTKIKNGTATDVEVIAREMTMLGTTHIDFDSKAEVQDFRRVDRPIFIQVNEIEKVTEPA